MNDLGIQPYRGVYVMGPTGAPVFMPVYPMPVHQHPAHQAHAAPCSCGQAKQASQDPNAPFGAPLMPPLNWFDPVTDDEPVDKVRIDDDGRVRGYWWTQGSCLLDGGNECWQPQPSPTGYVAFHQGDCPAIDENGQQVLVKVGSVGMDLSHADPYLDPSAASAHYANTGLQLVVARIGDNRHGGWIAGSVVAEATNGQVARMRRSGLSGDWRFFPRLIGKNASGWDSLGPIFVTRPGLPIDRSNVATARTASADPRGLVAVFGGFDRPWKAITAADAGPAVQTAPADAFSKAKAAVLEAYQEHADEGGFEAEPGAKIEHFASTNGVALWQVTDGYGEWFFAGNQDGVVWLCQKMPDVMAYASNDKLGYKLDNGAVKDMGMGDEAWRSWIIEQVNEERPRGAGVYKSGDKPLVSVVDTTPEAPEAPKTELPMPEVPKEPQPVVAATAAAIKARRAAMPTDADEKAVKAAWDAHLASFNFEPNAGVAAPTIEMFGMAGDGTMLWEIRNDRGVWYFAGSADSETGIRWLVQVMTDIGPSITLAPGMPPLADKLAAKAWDDKAWRTWIVDVMNKNNVLSEDEGANPGGAMDPTTDAAVTAATPEELSAGDSVIVEGEGDSTFLVVAVASLPDGGVYVVLDDGRAVPIEQVTKADGAMPTDDMGMDMDAGMLASALTALRQAAAVFQKARTAADEAAQAPAQADPLAPLMEKLDAVLASLGAIAEKVGAGSAPAPAAPPPDQPAPQAAAEPDEEMLELAAALS